jgi:hypothetical protein
MNFFFLDKNKFELTNYSYNDFDSIIKKFGYEQEKNESLHTYINWNKINHYSFKYESYSDSELMGLFQKSIVYDKDLFFIVRILHHLPLIKVNAVILGTMLEDLCYESGMGWEAISICGKYVIEFTDSYEYMAKSNFPLG